ncbi:MAG: TRC40/GET3/ArsA family transport-energizing ATPase [Actinomycetota bacterium]|nr:TRC40/GET3/ArsA family transport-energizing ATPase [Actinomycetota bacterium]
MRIILITGKGGVGKTTVAAATALRAADLGYATLVMSTDPAHSLADAFDVQLGDSLTTIVTNLDAQQIDSRARLEESWGAVRDHLTEIFDWSGLKGIEAEELTVFPGMDELFSLATVNDHARADIYDVIIVDCAPTAETLRLLSLPEVMSWYMDKMFPIGRRMVKVVRPVITKMSAMPVASDAVFDAIAKFYDRLEGIREILSDSEVTTARLVMNPEKMVIAEARRTYTYLGLFGYAVDSVIVNRVLPDTVADPYFARWREIQAEHLIDIEESFQGTDVRQLRLFEEEMIGVERLRRVAEELYRDVDPTDRLSEAQSMRVEDVEGSDDVALVLAVPFTEREEIDLMRHHDEIFITIGPYRRSIVLPDSLQRRTIRGARVHADELRIIFTLEAI